MQKDELQTIIGGNLQNIRRQRHMTQEQLAEMAGLSTTFYANLECGNRMMSVVTLCKLAQALRVSTDSLLYREHPSDCVDRIQTALRHQPEYVAELAEKMVQLCIQELPKALDCRTLSQQNTEERIYQDGPHIQRNN